MRSKSQHPVRLHRFLPFLGWIGELRDSKILRADVIAGITVAFEIVAQQGTDLGVIVDDQYVLGMGHGCSLYRAAAGRTRENCNGV
jgi:hypothetical protein